MKKIIFVCLGNICRSPMAEALMRHEIITNDLSGKLVVDSAATSRWEVGKPPHQGTQKILKQQGIDFAGIYARQITTQDFLEADVIIGMDQSNVNDLLKIAPEETKHKIQLFMRVVPGKETVEVPDPYYTGNFDETYALVSEGINKWLKRLF
ncbi:protein-tyrosine phosphatase [Enterococcus sp. AZ194]|uniref:low molecular weight protein-tyrosine-phosphatase n=1 Tax=Enterococcus sp. AZ194 TaxID=2774629 RepID=UPI003F211C0F